MAKSTTTASEDDLGPLMRALVIIEKLGNKLPHPFWLFLGLAVIVMFVSAICAAAGVSAVNPASGETVAVSNLFSTENLRAVVGGVVTNYVEFPALGLVLVVLFGVAVAERSGLFAVVMRGALRSASPRWVTAVVALVGTASSMASDASYMIVIPLGGMAFKAVGRNPVIGCAVAYAATAGGYSAAPFVNSLTRSSVASPPRQHTSSTTAMRSPRWPTCTGTSSPCSWSPWRSPWSPNSC